MTGCRCRDHGYPETVRGRAGQPYHDRRQGFSSIWAIWIVLIKTFCCGWPFKKIQISFSSWTFALILNLVYKDYSYMAIKLGWTVYRSSFPKKKSNCIHNVDFKIKTTLKFVGIFRDSPLKNQVFSIQFNHVRVMVRDTFSPYTVNWY